MSRRLAILAAAAVLAAPAYAGFSAGIDQSVGDHSYQTTHANASLDLGDSWTIAPNYTRYKADYTNGIYNDYGLRVAYESGPLALGVAGSVLPRVDGYQQGTVGGDLTFSLTPGGTTHGHKMAGPDSGSDQTFGAGLAAVDLGVSANEIMHSDQLQTVGQDPFGPTTSRAKAFDLGQTDLAAFAGVKFLITELSATVTKSYYDKVLDGQNLRAAPFLNITGISAIEQGFPDLSYTLRLKWKSIPVVQPYIAYTHTTYELSEPNSNAFEAGGTVGLQMLSVKGGYVHYEQTGLPNRDYIVLGASLNFSL